MQRADPNARTDSAVEERSSGRKWTEAGVFDNYAAWASHLGLSLLFWSQLAEIWATIWYIPMNEMKISGYELFLVLLMLPAALTHRGFRSLCLTHPYLRYFSLLGFITPFWRSSNAQIVLLAVGTAASATFTFLDIYALPSAPRYRAISALQMSLPFLMAIRIADASLNPIFHYRLVALIFAIEGALECKRYSSMMKNFQHHAIRKIRSGPKVGSALAGLAFGCALFNAHSFLTQSTVLFRWIDAPVSISSVALVVATLVFSAISTVELKHASLAGFIFLLAAQYAPSSLVSVFFAILWAMALCAAIVHAAESLHASGNPGTAISVAMGTYSGFGLLTVWTVAYPFVPGGEYTREHTALVYLISWIIMFFASGPISSKIFLPRYFTASGRKFTLWFVFVVLLLSCTWRGLNHAKLPADSNLHDPAPRIRSAIWAVHFGYDNFGQNSFDRIVTRLQETQANVIGLVESDLTRIFNGNWDLIDYLQYRMGLYADYGPSTLNNTWGCALLSAFPIIRADRHNLPSPQGEVACLIDATLQVGNEQVDVIVTHFGNEPHPEDRRLQTIDSHYRGRAIRSENKRALWLGYLTDRPGSLAHSLMVNAGWEDSTNDLDRWCLYIFSQRLRLQEFNRYPHGDDSDTEIQAATYQF